LHKATIESENHGQHFLRLVEDKVEPAIKDLSSCLINPDASVSQLDACIQRFEEALLDMRAARDHLANSINRVRTLGDRLVAEAAQ
jgi:hypothetical protein